MRIVRGLLILTALGAAAAGAWFYFAQEPPPDARLACHYGAYDLSGGGVAARPMSFVGAALFQWVNPKAWTMALTAVSAYTVPANYVPSLAALVLVFAIVNVPVVAGWTLFGTGVRSLLADAGTARIVNVIMAALLVLSILPMALARA